LVLLDGRIVQDDKPEGIMRRPANVQVARLVGMDNIIPCCSEQDSQRRFIVLNNGIRFLYHGKVCEPISACCLPGDALYLWDDRPLNQQGSWIMVEGLVERIIPGVGTYRILIKVGEQSLCVRVAPNHVIAAMQSYSRVKLAINPAGVHII